MIDATITGVSRASVKSHRTTAQCLRIIIYDETPN